MVKMLNAQKRPDGTSNADHAKRVRSVMVGTLNNTNETLAQEEQVILECAALGHDLLEDCDISKEKLSQQFGSKTVGIIEELTNTWGDKEVSRFVEQVINASEEARLIKYADLIDNLFHASFQLQADRLRVEWIHNFFLPITDPMREALKSTFFNEHPKTSMALRSTAEMARAHLAENIRISTND